MSKPYSAAEYVVGFLVLLALGPLLQLWPLALMLLVAGTGFWLVFRSPTALAMKERGGAIELHSKISALAPRTTADATAFVPEVLREIKEAISGRVPPGEDAIIRVCQMLSSEVVEDAGKVPPIPDVNDRIVLARYRDNLATLYQTLSAQVPDVNPAPPAAESIARLLLDLPTSILDAACEFEERQKSASCFVSIGELLEHPGMTIERMIGPFIGDDVEAAGHYASLRRQIELNGEAAKIMPGDRDGNAVELANIYLRDTPLRKLFDIQIPFSFPEEQRLEHMVIVAGSGHGKTQTLEALISADLDEPDPPGMVVIDSKGDMIERLARLDIFNPINGRLRDKLIIVDAHDGPNLNPFDIKLKDPSDEQAVSRLIGGMSYFFQALLGSDLSSTMRVALYPFLHLMLRVEGATMNTLIDAMADPTRYGAEIESLPDAPRNYLKHEYQRVRAETRNAIKDRLYDLRMMSPAFDRMFGARHNALDLPEALNQGKIVLVNLDRDYLEKEPSAILGKWFIAQTHRAALSRSTLPPRARRAAYLIVDEAGPYFDAQTEDILRTMRSYRVGAVLAFQDFSQAPPSLQSAIFSSTAIRLAGGSSDLDAKILAGPLRTDPAFILSRRKRDHRYSEFACFVSRLTPRAVSLAVPHGTVDRQRHMPEEHYQFMRLKNRALLTGLPELAASSPPPHDAAAENPEPELPAPPHEPAPPEASRRREAPIIKVGDRDDHTRLGKW